MIVFFQLLNLWLFLWQGWAYKFQLSLNLFKFLQYLLHKAKPMKTEQIKIDKGIHRSLMLEMGLYNIHKEKAYKDKKKYSRKEKHKSKY